ncbi:MAG: 4Fe-4S double cluster binding domain-containing protein [Rectinemataceae bacterium]
MHSDRAVNAQRLAPPDPERAGALLSGALDAQGLSVHVYLSGDALRAALVAARASNDLMIRYGAASASGCVAVALPYGEGLYSAPEWTKAWTEPQLEPRLESWPESCTKSGCGFIPAALARFVRADWYAELADRLAAAVAETRTALAEEGMDPGPRSAWHRLSNSPLPERPVACAAGLGWIGRNGILVAGTAQRPCAAGSAVVLGLLFMPFAPEGEPQPSSAPIAGAAGAAGDGRGLHCGSCRRCVDACPTGALREGHFVREACIQHWSAIPGALPPEIEKAWGNRLYGCDLCLEACPYFRPDPEAAAKRGMLGPALPARFFVESGDATVRETLRGTALGLGWMHPAAFRRNAALALRASASVSR